MAAECGAFERAMCVEAVGSHEYRAVLDPEYRIGAAAHGGFMVALMAMVVTKHFETTLASLKQPDTLSIHTEFLRRGKIGDVVVKVQDIRLRRQMSTILLMLVQESENVLLTTATNINRSQSTGLTIDTGYVLTPSVPPIHFASTLSHHDRHWVSYTMPSAPSAPSKAFSKFLFVVRRDPKDTERYFTQQWIRWLEPNQRFTTVMLGLVADTFVVPSENSIEGSPFTAAAVRDRALLSASGDKVLEQPMAVSPRWYLTLSSTLDIKRSLPEEGVEWLFTRTTVKAVFNGKVDIHCEVWDADGRLVALSQQIWMVIESSPVEFFKGRTTSGRSKM